MIIKSYPKVNLFLLVDKYNQNKNLHKISTVCKKIDNVYDEITINVFQNKENDKKKDKIVYFDKDANIIKIKNCIISKTLNLLRSKKIINQYYSISVIKKIPLGGGIGGGSSNAAEVIKFVLKNEKKKLTKKIMGLALSLGSDIPFFLSNYDLALISSYGSKIKKLDLNLNIKIKLFFNNINCSSKLVYEEYKKNNIFLSNLKSQMQFLKNKEFYKLVNELAPSCFKLYPDVAGQYNKKIQKNEMVMLSGSGSTLFQIIDNS